MVVIQQTLICSPSLVESVRQARCFRGSRQTQHLFPAFKTHTWPKQLSPHLTPDCLIFMRPPPSKRRVRGPLFENTRNIHTFVGTSLVRNPVVVVVRHEPSPGEKSPLCDASRKLILSFGGPKFQPVGTLPPWRAKGTFSVETVISRNVPEKLAQICPAMNT